MRVGFDPLALPQLVGDTVINQIRGQIPAYLRRLFFLRCSHL